MQLNGDRKPQRKTGSQLSVTIESRRCNICTSSSAIVLSCVRSSLKTQPAQMNGARRKKEIIQMEIRFWCACFEYGSACEVMLRM